MHLERNLQRFIDNITPAGALIIIGAVLLLLPLLVLFNDWIKRTRERTRMIQLTAPTPRPKPGKPQAPTQPRPEARPRFAVPPPPMPVIPAVPLPQAAPPPTPPPTPAPVPSVAYQAPLPPPAQPPQAPAPQQPAPVEAPAAPIAPTAAPAAMPKPPVWWVGQREGETEAASTSMTDRPLQMMRYRKLGRSGLMVSELGMGTWGMGGMWGPMNDREAIKSIHRAMDLGVNFIDTALAYGDGHAEELIGSALKQRAEPVYVATKVPPKNMQWPAHHDVPASEVFPDAWVIACTEVSLRHLRRERLDLLQLHVWAPRWLHERDVWLPAVERLKKDGKIRAFGLSINDCEPDTALEAVASGLIDTIQVIYNIFEQAPAEKLFPACQQHDVGVIVRSPLDEGSLSGILTPDTVFHPEDWRKEYFKGERLQQTVQRVEQLRFLIRDEVTTLSHAALKFCLSQPAVSTVIPGMRRVTHVQENCAVSDGKSLTAQELKQLRDHAWPRNFYVST